MRTPKPIVLARPRLCLAAQRLMAYLNLCCACDRGNCLPQFWSRRHLSFDALDDDDVRSLLNARWQETVQPPARNVPAGNVDISTALEASTPTVTAEEAGGISGIRLVKMKRDWQLRQSCSNNSTFSNVGQRRS